MYLHAYYKVYLVIGSRFRDKASSNKCTCNMIGDLLVWGKPLVSFKNIGTGQTIHIFTDMV